MEQEKLNNAELAKKALGNLEAFHEPPPVNLRQVRNNAKQRNTPPRKSSRKNVNAAASPTPSSAIWNCDFK